MTDKKVKQKKKPCKECGTKFEPFNSLDKYCSMSCRYEGAKKIIEVNRKKKVLLAKKEHAEWKKDGLEKLKKKGAWESDLQKEINHIARLIDKNVGCIATGFKTGKMNGGHRTSVKSNPSIRFNLHNIFCQSEHSNNWKGGDNDRFDDGLIRLYGQEYKDYVQSLRQTPPIKLSIETIREKISIAKLIVKELKELQNTYNPAERIQLRNELNFRLGVYLDCFQIVKSDK